MDLTARPLLATGGDMGLFVGRDREVAEVERALGRGFNVLLEGARGAGRTSLLRSLAYHHRADEAPAPQVALVRAAGATDPASLLARVVGTLEAAPEAVPNDGPPRVDTVDALIARLAALVRERPRVVLLDDVAPAVGAGVFGVLRDELWEAGASWVVAATPETATALLAPPADAFFEVVVRLGDLTPDEAVELLARRLPEVPVARLRQVADGTTVPRELLERARRVDWKDDADLDGVHASQLAWERALAGLGRSASMLAVELRDLGPVSASDERLLERMGWTRPRAIQVLGRLQEAGLVTSVQVPQDGPGRPRKVFRLVGPDELARRAGSDTRRSGA